MRVFIYIGQIKQGYDLSQLQQLPLFKNSFEWTSDTTSIVKITKCLTSTNIISILAINKVIFIINEHRHASFFNHFTLRSLIACYQHQSNILRVKPTCSNIESILLCQDYLVKPSNHKITVQLLEQYFNQYMDHLSYHNRKILLSKASHATLITALTRIQHKIRQHIKHYYRIMPKNYLQIPNALFKHLNKTNIRQLMMDVKFSIMQNKVNKKIKIFIHPFTTSQHFCALVSSVCKCTRLMFLPNIKHLLHDIQHFQLKGYIINCNNKYMKAIQHLTKCLMQQINVDLEKYSTYQTKDKLFQVPLLQCCRMRWELHFNNNCLWKNPWIVFMDSILYMHSHTVHSFTLFILTLYCKNNTLLQSNEVDKYYGFIQCCLRMCYPQWILEHVNLWFDVMHKLNNSKLNVYSTCEWIHEHIVSQFQVEQKAEFAVFLTQYFVYQWKFTNSIPKQYLLFINNQLGINWKLF